MKIAAAWTEQIKQTYKQKGIPENISRPVLKETAEHFTAAVDKSLGGVDYDAVDETFRQYMKNNIWKFSTAKNYNDCVRLSNLLVRPDGSIRPWNEFKKEAEKVVGASNRYLKTEYETIFVSAQNARLWQEIQRDKHIFPFCQFKVVMDGHTTEICAPLHNVIVSVDDPMLALYFPMNHFGCRTTVIKLRKGTPTEDVKWPEIPEAFRNNVGVAGQIFTDKNSYIDNAPKDVLNISGVFAKRQQKFEELLKDENYTDVEFGDMLGLKATHKDHKFDVAKGHYEKEVQDILFNNGHSIILESEKGFGKQVEGFFNGRPAEIKTLEGNNPNTVRKRVAQSVGKGADVCILYFPNGLELDINEVMKTYFGTRPKKIIVISGNRIVE